MEVNLLCNILNALLAIVKHITVLLISLLY